VRGGEGAGGPVEVRAVRGEFVELRCLTEDHRLGDAVEPRLLTRGLPRWPSTTRRQAARGPTPRVSNRVWPTSHQISPAANEQAPRRRSPVAASASALPVRPGPGHVRLHITGDRHALKPALASHPHAVRQVTPAPPG
jgi:hypothetical protein